MPADLSVIGFDDIDMAGWDRFSLTTVRQSTHRMARAAAGLLLERIDAEGDLPARSRVFPIRLIARDTHGPVPA